MNEEIISKSLVTEKMIYNSIEDTKYNYKVTVNFDAVLSKLLSIVCILSKETDADNLIYESVGFMSYDGQTNNISLNNSELDNALIHIGIFKQITNTNNII